MILSLVLSSCLPRTVILVPSNSFLSLSSVKSVCRSDFTRRLPTLLNTGVWSVTLSSSETALSVSEASISSCCFWVITACNVCCSCCSLPSCSCNCGGSSTSSVKKYYLLILKSFSVCVPIKGCDNIHCLHCDGDEPEKSVGRCSQRDDIICEDLQF